MNRKVILTGKAILATVMASSMTFSMLTTNIYAEENVNLEAPETSEETVASNDVSTVVTNNDLDVVEEEEVAPTQPEEGVPLTENGDVPVTYSFAPNEDPEMSVEEYRVRLQGLLDEAASLFEENKFTTSLEGDYSRTKSTAEALLANPEATTEKLSWQCYYMNNLVNRMKDPTQLLTESGKAIVLIYKEFSSMNKAQYDVNKWASFEKDINSAISKVNGNPDGDFSSILPEIQSAFEELKASKIDENLAKLKDVLYQAEDIVSKQYSSSSRKNYTFHSWTNFLASLNVVREEVAKGESTIDPSLAETLIDELTNAMASLVEVQPGEEGAESGLLSTWTDGWDGEHASYQTSTNIRGGRLYVCDEVTNGDGTTTITVAWSNTGVDPLTGGKFHNYGSAERKWGEYSYRPYTESDLNKRIYFETVVKDANGEYYKDNGDIDNLSKEQILNGFTQTFVVPSGSSIELNIGQVNSNVKTSSLGTYYTYLNSPDTVAPEVKVSYEKSKDEKSMVVTLTADEAIADIEGWTRVSENVLQRTYTKNMSEDVVVTDLAGNSRKVRVTVTGLKSETTTEDKNDTDSKEQSNKKEEKVKTGVALGTSLLTGTTLAAATGIATLSFLKKRKK